MHAPGEDVGGRTVARPLTASSSGFDWLPVEIGVAAAVVLLALTAAVLVARRTRAAQPAGA